jgi:hypothetical protein
MVFPAVEVIKFKNWNWPRILSLKRLFKLGNKIVPTNDGCKANVDRGG